MKHFIQFISLITVVSFMVPLVTVAQSADRARAQQEIQNQLPAGVTVETATIEQIEAAMDNLAGLLSEDDFAELSGEMAAVFGESRPEIAAEAAAAIVRAAPANRVASVAVSVAANAASSSAGRAGASSASAIAQQVSGAAAPRGGVPAAALGQAIVNSVPAAAAEITESLGVQVTAPATPQAPPSGARPVQAPPSTPVVTVPPGPPVDAPPDFVDVPEDPEVPSPMAN